MCVFSACCLKLRTNWDFRLRLNEGGRTISITMCKKKFCYMVNLLTLSEYVPCDRVFASTVCVANISTSFLTCRFCLLLLQVAAPGECFDCFARKNEKAQCFEVWTLRWKGCCFLKSILMFHASLIENSSTEEDLKCRSCAEGICFDFCLHPFWFKAMLGDVIP